MRASTPSFVVSVKAHLPEQIENHLEKSYRTPRISRPIHN